jgi:hypothetical protein
LIKDIHIQTKVYDTQKIEEKIWPCTCFNPSGLEWWCKKDSMDTTQLALKKSQGRKIEQAAQKEPRTRKEDDKGLQRQKKE